MNKTIEQLEAIIENITKECNRFLLKSDDYLISNDYMPCDGGNYDDTHYDGQKVGKHFLAKTILTIVEENASKH
jgi:hypothetical protein